MEVTSLLSRPAPEKQSQWTKPQLWMLWLLVFILIVNVATFWVAVDAYEAINHLPPLPR